MATDTATAPPRPKASALLDDVFERLRIPPTAQRVALGVLVFLGIYIGAVGIPSYAIQVLQANNVPVSISLTTLMYYGGAMAVAGGAAYAVRPYRAYGPVAMVTDWNGAALPLASLQHVPPLAEPLGRRRRRLQRRHRDRLLGRGLDPDARSAVHARVGRGDDLRGLLPPGRASLLDVPGALKGSSSIPTPLPGRC